MKETKDILTTEQVIEEIKYQAYRLGKVDEISEALKLISQMHDLKSEEKYIDEIYEELCIGGEKDEIRKSQLNQ